MGWALHSLGTGHEAPVSARRGATTSSGWGEAVVHRLSRQIARYGELAGRELAARADAGRRARHGRSPAADGPCWNHRQLSAEEQLELHRLAGTIRRSSQPGPRRLGQRQPLRLS